MAKMLYCPSCQALAAVTEEHPRLCATCGNQVEWRETFTLTRNDRKFLAQLRISSE